MADQDRYRDDRDDDRRRGGDRGGGDPYRGGEGPPGPGRASPPRGGYGRQGGYDQGGREDQGRHAGDYGREDRGGGQRGDPRGDRGHQDDPRGRGGAGRERSDYGPRVNEDIGQGAYGQGYVGNQGRGYGSGLGGAERDPSRNAQAYDADPEDRSWWERATDQVATWFGDEGAEQRRDADREADHRGRGPKGYKRSDERIREDVNDRLYDDSHVDASEIEVSVSGGEVTLTGTVDGRDARRRAEDVAERVSGVTYVQNNLRVNRPGSVPGPRGATGASTDQGAPGGSSGASSDVTTPAGLGSGGASTGMGATGGSAGAGSGTGMADTGNAGAGIPSITGTNRTSGN
jgi:osmotically-inducible protein OsmY